MFKLTRDETKMIYDILANEEETLTKIPNRLDNGSTDGDSNEFEFLGTGKVTAWNIKKTYRQAVWLANHKYYEQYKENMEHENAVIRIFERICQRLKKQGIEMSLGACRVRDDCRVRVTWEEL